MSTSLEVLRQSLATHDAALTVFLCDRARCGVGDPAAYPAAGWVGPIRASLEAETPGPALIADFEGRVERDYRTRVLPALVLPDMPNASAADVRTCDTACIRAVLLRLRFAVHVAESKFEAPDARLLAAAAAGDAAQLDATITYPAVEQAVVNRVAGYVADYARRHHLEPACAERLSGAVTALYRTWLIPLSRDVQVAWLIAAASPIPSGHPRRGV
jgi:chorismate mutase